MLKVRDHGSAECVGRWPSIVALPLRRRPIPSLWLTGIEDGDQHGGDQAAERVGNQVPAGVLIAADVRLGQDPGGDELDHLVGRPDAHPGGHADRQEAHRRAGRRSSAGERSSKPLPADPGHDPEAVGMDQLIELEQPRHQPEVVEDVGLPADRPGGGHGHQPARHVGHPPDRQAPERGRAEPDPHGTGLTQRNPRRGPPRQFPCFIVKRCI